MNAGDARYDQPQRRCVCGHAYFMPLHPSQVHDKPDYPGYELLPPVAARTLVPFVECLACETRYDADWNVVV